MTLRLAQVLLALVFVLGGLATLRDPHPRADELARFHLPFPILLVRLNALVMVIAGSALALDVRPALASTVLALVLLPTTLVGHAFWTVGGVARQQQAAHFVKNLAVIGGLIALSVAAR